MNKNIIGILCCCGNCLLLAAGSAVAGSSLLRHINSDSLYLLSFYHDLFLRDYSVRGWNMQPAPSFFPDMVIFFPALQLVSDFGYGYVLYSVVLLLGILIGFTVIAYMLSKNILASALCASAAGAFLICVLGESGFYVQSFLFPASHSGCILSGLLLIIVSLFVCSQGFAFYSALSFLLLIFLASLSDMIFIPQFLLPVLAAFYVLSRRKMVPGKTVRLASLLTGGALLLVLGVRTAMQLCRILTIPTLPVVLRQPWDVLQSFFKDSKLILSEEPVYYIAALAVCLGVQCALKHTSGSTTLPGFCRPVRAHRTGRPSIPLSSPTAWMCRRCSHALVSLQKNTGAALLKYISITGKATERSAHFPRRFLPQARRRKHYLRECARGFFKAPTDKIRYTPNNSQSVCCKSQASLVN